MRRLLGRWFPRLFPRFARLSIGGRAPTRGQAVAPNATLKPSRGGQLVRTRGKPRLMACDPDPAVLNFISTIAAPWYSVIAARDPGWAKAWLNQYHDIVACVAGEKLTSDQGVALLDRCRNTQPSMLRVLVTENIDSADTVKALLTGIAHRLVESPMCQENLGMAIDPEQLRASAAQHVTITDRRKLLTAA